MNDMFNEMFGDNRKESPLADILRGGDVKELETFLKKYDVKDEKSELFLILDKITITKDKDFDVSTVKYNKFIIEEMLMRSRDCYAVMRTLSIIGDALTDQQHYDYLVRNVPVGRKNFKDRVKQYMAEGAKETLIKILLCRYYDCRMEVAEDYLAVLLSANKVNEFIMDQRWYLETKDCHEQAYKILKDKDSRLEYEILVKKIMEVKIDRN